MKSQDRGMQSFGVFCGLFTGGRKVRSITVFSRSQGWDVGMLLDPHPVPVMGSLGLVTGDTLQCSEVPVPHPGTDQWRLGVSITLGTFHEVVRGRCPPSMVKHRCSGPFLPHPPRNVACLSLHLNKTQFENRSE